jgi:hypothetical protein
VSAEANTTALRAAALHRLLELTECGCGYRGLHSTFCLAEYRQDVEALVGPIEPDGPALPSSSAAERLSGLAGGSGCTCGAAAV